MRAGRAGSRAVLVAVVTALAVTAWTARCARAELLEVRQVAGGMECPECARGLRLRIKNIAGVDDAETSWNRRVLTVRLHLGNHATLGQIRAAVIGQHFQAKEAEIVVAGRLVVEAGGAPALHIPETGQVYRIDLTGRDARWRRVFLEAAGGRVVVTGRVPGGQSQEDPLVLFPVDLPRPSAVISAR